MMTSSDRFRDTFSVLHNLALWDLEDAGVIKPGAGGGGSSWTRFNDDLTTFVLKLPTDRLGKLFALVERKLAEAA
ncbi:hypothetical protein [Mesorhizobium sp.]|uniref:hypothetical protein n=1 Tax=Mesorhizobium sp. TaxID=1871066 RepID=UPI00121332F3|nr:hypothetical protein [Mesorhizobium sp.]TIL38549.1 MAG: hypothetical protein E5Y82_13705 [Mesorhizobium sp.]